MQRRTVAIALVGAAVGTLALYLAFCFDERSHAVTPAPGRTEAVDAVFGSGVEETDVARPTHDDAAAALPDSLRNTEADGALGLDANGRFAPDRGALALFDYFLSATGEEPEPALRARIVSEISRRLPPDAAREAETFLDRYLAYRDAARRMSDDDRLALGGDLERRLQWVRELRREHFGAALAERLFGDDERSVAIALERRRVFEDPTLAPEERRARIDALEATLPAATRRPRAEATLPLRLEQEEAALREAGADAAAIRALREASVGVEAADRLDALDAQREAWQLRIAAYRSERVALEEATSLEPAQREAAVEELRARHFDATERIRVRALDAMEPAAPGPDAPTNP